MALTKIGTDGVKDDAVTSDKVANSINTAIAANTAKTQTTINNNADNRVITGSGTANTLEAESKLTYNGNQLLKVSTDASSYGTLNLSGNSGGLLQFADNDTLVWEVYTNSNELTIYDRTVNGYNTKFKAGGNVEIENGDLKFASGHGIDFSATSGSGTSELFDDYEEGTWTPASNTGNTASSYGSYTKIGRMVYAAFNIDISSNSHSTQASITGLPFSTEDASPNSNGVAPDYQTYDVQDGPIYHLGKGSTQITLYKNNGAALHSSNISGKNLRGVAIYRTA